MHERDVRHTIHLYSSQFTIHASSQSYILIVDVFVLISDVSFLLYFCEHWPYNFRASHLQLPFNWWRNHLFVTFSILMHYAWNCTKAFGHLLCVKLTFLPKTGQTNNNEILENLISGNSRCEGGFICILVFVFLHSNIGISYIHTITLISFINHHCTIHTLYIVHNHLSRFW